MPRTSQDARTLRGGGGVYPNSAKPSIAIRGIRCRPVACRGVSASETWDLPSGKDAGGAGKPIAACSVFNFNRRPIPNTPAA
jgi:hypothetical protein